MLTHLIELLQPVGLFSGLDNSELTWWARAAQIREVDRGRFFFKQAERADFAYLLHHGYVKVTQTTPEGAEVVERFVTPGEIFGCTAALVDQPYPTSAQALSWCQAFAWSREVLGAFMETHPRVVRNALNDLTDQLREFQNRCQELATRRVEHRIARALARLAGQAGRQTRDGLLIDMPLSRQDLAAMTGTTLYTVSRVLSAWERRGLIATGRQWVAVVQLDGLPGMKIAPRPNHAVGHSPWRGRQPALRDDPAGTLR